MPWALDVASCRRGSSCLVLGASSSPPLFPSRVCISSRRAPESRPFSTPVSPPLPRTILRSLYAGDNAYMSRTEEGDSEEPVVYKGAERIGEAMTACKDLRTEISSVNHQPIESDGKSMIMIQVIGYLTEGDMPTRKFCECFILTVRARKEGAVAPCLPLTSFFFLFFFSVFFFHPTPPRLTPFFPPSQGTEVDGRPRYAISNDQFCYLKEEEDDEAYELETLEPTPKPVAPAAEPKASAAAAAPTVTQAAPKPDPAAKATPPAEKPRPVVGAGTTPAAVPQAAPAKGPVKVVEAPVAKKNVDAAPVRARPGEAKGRGWREGGGWGEGGEGGEALGAITRPRHCNTPPFASAAHCAACTLTHPTPTSQAEPAVNGSATQPISYAARLKKAAAPAPAPASNAAPPAAKPRAAGGASQPKKSAGAAPNAGAAASETAAEDGQQAKAPAAAAQRPRSNLPVARRVGDVLTNSIFIGSVPQDTTEDELRAVFSAAGKVLTKYIDNNQECDGVEIITTSNNNKPNAIAFVTFESDESARRCISGDLLGTFELRGHPLNVRERKVRESRGSKGARGGYVVGWERGGGVGNGGARAVPRFFVPVALSVPLAPHLLSLFSYFFPASFLPSHAPLAHKPPLPLLPSIP